MKMSGHILPDTNAAYDIGSAEYKVRHMYYLIIHYGLVMNTKQLLIHQIINLNLEDVKQMRYHNHL